MKKYAVDCLFINKELAMEGTMFFCLNPNSYPQKDWENLSPNCEKCIFYLNKREVRERIIEKQRRLLNETN